MVRHALSSRAASKIVHDFNHPYLLGQQPYKSDKTASRALLLAVLIQAAGIPTIVRLPPISVR